MLKKTMAVGRAIPLGTVRGAVRPGILSSARPSTDLAVPRFVTEVGVTLVGTTANQFTLFPSTERIMVLSRVSGNGLGMIAVSFRMETV